MFEQLIIYNLWLLASFCRSKWFSSAPTVFIPTLPSKQVGYFNLCICLDHIKYALQFGIVCKFLGLHHLPNLLGIRTAHKREDLNEIWMSRSIRLSVSVCLSVNGDFARRSYSAPQVVQAFLWAKLHISLIICFVPIYWTLLNSSHTGAVGMHWYSGILVWRETWIIHMVALIWYHVKYVIWAQNTVWDFIYLGEKSFFKCLVRAHKSYIFLILVFWIKDAQQVLHKKSTSRIRYFQPLCCCTLVWHI